MEIRHLSALGEPVPEVELPSPVVSRQRAGTDEIPGSCPPKRDNPQARLSNMQFSRNSRNRIDVIGHDLGEEIP
jgi:hypothetical protein